MTYIEFKVLVADDDPVFRSLICDILRKQKYIPVEAENGQQAIDIFFSDIDICLCILDVMMPVYDGWEVLKEIREKSDVPIIMLTALGDEQHEVAGLSYGADDYIAKPFSYPVFVARIESLLRKKKRENESRINIGRIFLDRSNHKVMVGDEEIILNNKEYHLLLYFITNKGIVLDREKILYAVWGYDFEGDIRTIDAHIKMLRNKLLDCNGYIRTVRGTGYVFEVEDEKLD